MEDIHMYIVHVLCNVRCKKEQYTVKGLSIFPSPDGDGMSLTKLSMAGNN